MAGTLTISTLSDGTNSTSSTNCIRGPSLAWVNFNGSSGAIRAAYNVGSVTRTSTGLYQVNITNALSDNNYCVVIGGAGSISDPSGRTYFGCSNTSSSAIKVTTVNASGGYVDGEEICVSCYR